MTHTSPSRQRYVAAVALAALLTACGGSSAPAPTPTRAPEATATTVPTATPAPTATPKASPTPEPKVAATIAADASASTKDAQGGEGISARMATFDKAGSFKSVMTMTMTGDAMGLPVKVDPNMPVMSFEVTKSGDNSRIVFGGLLAGLMGSENGVEYLVVDGKTYVKGPAMLLGAPDDKWYLVPEDRISKTLPPFTPQTMLDEMFKGQKADDTLKPAGTETLDGQTCDVYIGSKEDILKSSNSLSRDFDSIDAAEAKAYICADGFLHLMSMSFTGKSKSDPSKEAGMSLIIRMTDFNVPVVLTAPAESEPLKSPLGLTDLPDAGTAEATPESLTAEATPEATAEEAQGSESGDVPAASTGKFDSPFPLLGAVENFTKISDEMVNFQTDATLKQVYAFYTAEYKKLGYKERKITTIVSEQVVNLVLDGGDDGKSIVVQAFPLTKDTVNVSVRKEKV